MLAVLHFFQTRLIMHCNSNWIKRLVTTVRKIRSLAIGPEFRVGEKQSLFQRKRWRALSWWFEQPRPLLRPQKHLPLRWWIKCTSYSSLVTINSPREIKNSWLKTGSKECFLMHLTVPLLLSHPQSTIRIWLCSERSITYELASLQDTALSLCKAK